MSGPEPAVDPNADIGPWRRFLVELCDRRRYVLVVFALSVLFLVVQLPYMLVVERDSALYVISVMNLAGLLVFAAASGALLYKCREVR